jgi:hypothetical protein
MLTPADELRPLFGCSLTFTLAVVSTRRLPSRST